MIGGREVISQQEVEEAVKRTCGHHPGVKQLERACGSIPRIGERRLSLRDTGSINLIETFQRKVYLAPDYKRGGIPGAFILTGMLRMVLTLTVTSSPTIPSPRVTAADSAAFS